jgi:hypothetical protein
VVNSLHSPIVDGLQGGSVPAEPEKAEPEPAEPQHKRRKKVEGILRPSDRLKEERSADRRVKWGPSTRLTNPRSIITAKDLSVKWNISFKRAKETLRVTTQRGVRNLSNPLVRRLRTKRWYNKRVLKGRWYSDTMHFKPTSIIRQEKAAQVFTNGKGYDEFIPIERESRCSDGLLGFCNDTGIPEHLVVDGAKAQGSHETHNTNWQKVVRANHIKQTWIQPHCWWQNLAEKSIAEIRKEIRRLQASTGSPHRLWAFLGSFIAGKRQRTATVIPSSMGRTAFEVVHGYTPDISLYVIHDWYEFIWWYDLADKTEKLGRWLGPSGEKFGGGDCHYVLHRTGRIHVTNSTRSITEDEWNRRDINRLMDQIDNDIVSKIGDQLSQADESDQQEEPVASELFDDDDSPLIEEPEASMPDADEYTPEQYDEYIGNQVLIPIGTEMLRGVVIRRHRDLNGNLYGVRDTNPILDTRKYDVRLPDGSVETYGTNIIQENLMSNVDDEGNLFVLLDEIISHKRTDKALSEKDAWYTSKTGSRKQRRPTTKGWQLLISWKDGTTSWARLADMKESFPIEVSEYAKAVGIIDQAAFAWWCPRVLRKKERLISGAKTKYWLKTHKYGVRLPKTIKEALLIDKETGTDLWAKAIAKEMKNVMITFEFKDGDPVPVGHQRVTVHMVFDVKITLQRKARLVADGHKVTETSKEHTYSSVPSRDSVRLFFLIAALNDLDVLSADIQNAYLTAPIKERYYVVARSADGFPPEYEGRPAKIVRAMYGLPVAGASFRAYLAQHLRDLGYKPCKADADVHMKVAVKENGDTYYQYMLAYVDDILCCGENPQVQMDMISGKFTLKDGTVEEPQLYLGADIEKFFIEGDDASKTRWAISSSNYTKKAIDEVERELATAEYGFTCLPKRVRTPLAGEYRPEMDPTPELNDKKQNYYQGLIGILRWICELGRLDIIMPVSLMSRYLAQAREGHLQQVFHMFSYLKEYPRSRLVFDDTRATIPDSRFHTCDWTEFYPDAKEVMPPDMPEPRGNSVKVTCFVDADHAGCKETRRSHTGVLIFVNRAPILWFSKRQSTVETSTFGSEIVALRIAIEMIEGLRYKLRMMGVPIDGPCDLFCDNESVVKNVTRAESPLKKKHNSIAYHKARECIAAGIVRVGKEDGVTNVADLLTKLLDGNTLRDLSSRCMW